MAEKWIDFVCVQLRRGICQHYFIDKMNILEGYSTVSLLKAAAILENVKLDDTINLNLFIEQDKLAFDSNKNLEDWLKSLKIDDVLRVNDDYKQLKQNWLLFDSSYAEGHNIACFYILNQLRIIDGEKENNLSRFKYIFLDSSETSRWQSPLNGETVATISISDFVDSLIGFVFVLKNIQDAICNGIVPAENIAGPDSSLVQQGQNVFSDLMSQQGLVSLWIPLFTGQHFGYRHPVQSDFRQLFERRSVLDFHPDGPLPSFISPDHPVFTDIVTAASIYNDCSVIVSDRLANLLTSSTDQQTTISSLINQAQTTSTQASKKTIELVPSTTSNEMMCFATNKSPGNNENVCVVIYDPNFDVKDLTDEIANSYRSINDYCLFYTDSSQLKTHVRSIDEETIYLVLVETAEQYVDETNDLLLELKNLIQVGGIFLHCSNSKRKTHYRSLLSNADSKLTGIFSTMTELLKTMKISIEQQQNELIIYPSYNPSHTHMLTLIVGYNSHFFWNLLIKQLYFTSTILGPNLTTTANSGNEYFQQRHLFIENVKEYYADNIFEMNNIKEFEKDYQSDSDAIKWFLKTNCFLYKWLSKAFCARNVDQLKLMKFFIMDLISNLEHISPQQSTMTIDNKEKIYFKRLVSTKGYETLLKSIDKLIIFDGFLVMNPSADECCCTGM
ncbi:unnamed protein product [Didymodactylos carnosus]|uniref:Uncharacterized protein n=1 Tax=Didymodactylos carnosus TaxID=1234261 RepID=A0A815HB17_9BILA|nr:unnamed protein product [Didymodactylos carnosus]CAF4222273.1 unnamed protein product [Didymodactylos carnosus]